MAEPVDFDPTNNPIHAIRLEYGDFDEDTYILSDQSYQYYIDKHYNSMSVASKSIGMAILATFAREGYRQRVGQEEAYLGDRYNNYLDWLKQKVTNPLLSGRIPAVYVGGVFIDTIKYYDENPELVSSQFFRGQHNNTKTYLQPKNRFGIIK
jgi:hypothetical protein